MDDMIIEDPRIEDPFMVEKNPFCIPSVDTVIVEAN
jgi:hypothetical protein